MLGGLWRPRSVESVHHGDDCKGPSKLRLDWLRPGPGGQGNGVAGTPRRSTVAYGEQMLEMQIAAAVAQIEQVRPVSRE